MPGTVHIKLLIARMAARKGDYKERDIMLFDASLEAAESKDQGLMDAVADCCKELGIYGR